jgi:hypothetical protein
MPLMPGKSKKAFSKNVETEMKAGKPQNQSLAIAYNIKSKNKKKMAKGGVATEYGKGPEKTTEPGVPARKADDRREPDSATMSEQWSKGNPPARKPDDQRRPKDAFMDTNDWSDGEKPSRKPFADGGSVLTTKPNAPRPSQEATESADLNAKSGRGKMSPAQMAEWHEQEGARYRMMAQGGVAEVDGEAEEDGYMGTPPRKGDDHRFPADEFMSTDKWSKGNPPARKPDDERYPKSEYDNGARFADGGDVEPATDDEVENATSKKPMTAEPATTEDMEKSTEGGYDEDKYKDRRYKDPSSKPEEDAIEPGMFADGGEAEGHYDSVADAIMAKQKRAGYADGGVADVDENAHEEPNHEDDLSFEALKKENYSEQAGLDQMGSPEDSNEHDVTLTDEDEHGKESQFDEGEKFHERGADDTTMLNEIMRKMRMKRAKDDSKV